MQREVLMVPVIITGVVFGMARKFYTGCVYGTLA